MTERQMEILNFIRSYLQENHFPPTIREIAKGFGFKSPRAVQCHLESLTKAGALTIISKASRGIQLSPEFMGIPIIGRVVAGPPETAFQEVEGYLDFNNDMPTKVGETFALRVKGDSMMDAGILEGDLVVVRSQAVAKNGDIVVARVGEDTTVKRLVRKPGEVYLQPANSKYRRIEINEETTIVGKVMRVIRNYN